MRTAVFLGTGGEGGIDASHSGRHPSGGSFQSPSKMAFVAILSNQSCSKPTYRKTKKASTLGADLFLLADSSPGAKSASKFNQLTIRVPKV